MAEYNSAYTGAQIDAAIGAVNKNGPVWDSHVEDASIHVTEAEKQEWNKGGAFIAIYGTTTSAEIEAAYQAGKTVLAEYAFTDSMSNIGVLYYRGSATSHYFACSGADMVCENDSWSLTQSLATATHAWQHAAGGSDPITPESIGAAKNPKRVSVTLTAAGWDSTSYTQTVTVSGILANETKQLIQPVPAAGSQAAYIESGILCTEQAENSLTFTAAAVPVVDLTVYVVIQEVSE